jgi:hypothetical protein
MPLNVERSHSTEEAFASAWVEGAGAGLAVASDRPNRPWVLLAEIVNRLDVSWDEAELAAVFAAAQGWIEYHAHSLLLREPGRQNAGGRCAAEASQAGLKESAAGQHLPHG